jgi:serine/threonine protein kinase
LQFLGYLGAGGFGYVSLERHTETKSYYALKALSKGHLVMNGMQESAMQEKNILIMLDHPCIVKLFNTYKDEQTLYFLMEACVVGDLYHVLNRNKLHGDLDCSAYYSAVVIQSFLHLHMKRVVYRDLKPENVLMNEKGQVKICDMGIAKVVVGRTWTMCGTPEYMAPEVIQQKGHGVSCDWWCLGIFIYELLTGVTPFCMGNASSLAVYKAINKGIDKHKFPNKVRKEDQDLIKSLLVLDPSRRVPMLVDGVDKLKKSTLYDGIEWFWLGTKDGVEKRVPFTPKVDMKRVCKGKVHQDDINSITSKYIDDGSGWDQEF